MLTQCLRGNVKCAVLVWTAAARCCEPDGSEGKKSIDDRVVRG